MEDFESILATSGLMVIDFYSTHCHPCMQIMKILPTLANDLKELAVVAKADVDLNPEWKTKYNVTKLPTFLILKDGKEVHRFEGVTLMKNIKEKVLALSATDSPDAVAY